MTDTFSDRGNLDENNYEPGLSTGCLVPLQRSSPIYLDLKSGQTVSAFDVTDSEIGVDATLNNLKFTYMKTETAWEIVAGKIIQEYCAVKCPLFANGQCRPDVVFLPGGVALLPNKRVDNNDHSLEST